MLPPLFSISNPLTLFPVEERGNFLCLARKHTRNTSCIRFTAFAKLLSAMQLLQHSVTSTGGTKEKYPLNTSQKKSFIL